MPLVSYNPAAGLDNTVKTVTLRRSRGGFTFRGGVAKDSTKCDILIDTEKQEIGFRFDNDTIGYAVQHKSVGVAFVKCIRIFSEHTWLKDAVLDLAYDKSLKAWIVF